MARSIWTGAISFGLVNIPVKLYPAVREHDIGFHLVRAGSGHRIRYEKLDAETGKKVESSDIVKGFEVTPGNWVTFTDDELEELRPRSTKTLDIEDFVDLAEIDPIYFDKTYYLVPGDNAGARRAYALLVAAMEERGRVGIGTVVIRLKQYLAAVRVLDGRLVLSTMEFADEIVDPGTIEGFDERLPKADAKALRTAVGLIDAMATDWRPERYHDTYTEEVRDALKRKAKGEEVVHAEEERPAPVTDLLAALQSSVERARAGRSVPAKKRVAAKAARGRKSAGPARRKTTKAKARKRSAA